MPYPAGRVGSGYPNTCKNPVIAWNPFNNVVSKSTRQIRLRKAVLYWNIAKVQPKQIEKHFQFFQIAVLRPSLIEELTGTPATATMLTIRCVHHWPIAHINVPHQSGKAPQFDRRNCGDADLVFLVRLPTSPH